MKKILIIYTRSRSSCYQADVCAGKKFVEKRNGVILGFSLSSELTQ